MPIQITTPRETMMQTPVPIQITTPRETMMQTPGANTDFMHSPPDRMEVTKKTGLFSVCTICWDLPLAPAQDETIRGLTQ